MTKQSFDCAVSGPRQSCFRPVSEVLNTPCLKPETSALEAIDRDTNPDARRTKAKQ